MKKQSVHMIAAVQECDRGIGYLGDLLYHLPEDMRHFKELTTDTVVIMGRATWQSLPEKFRPLPHRINIVITRDSNFEATGAQIAHSLDEALEKAYEYAQEIYIIGGAQIYTLALPKTDHLHLTLIKGNKQADTLFPEYEKDFILASQGEEKFDEKENTSYVFCEYVRRGLEK